MIWTNTKLNYISVQELKQNESWTRYSISNYCSKLREKTIERKRDCKEEKSELNLTLKGEKIRLLWNCTRRVPKTLNKYFSW